MRAMDLSDRARTGERFGLWEVIQGATRDTRLRSKIRCKCGGCDSVSDVSIAHLLEGRSTKCRKCADRNKPAKARDIGGKRIRVDGERSLLNRVWRHMLKRCFDSTCHAFARYGGRGISVCDEWRTSFERFESWAMANGYVRELTLDRIDNDGGYCPQNCRFASYEQQANNRSSSRVVTAFGESKTIGQWAKDPRCAVQAAGLHRRFARFVDRGLWSIEQAIATRSRRRNAARSR